MDKKQGGNGGDVVFVPGKGYRADGVVPGFDGSIVLRLANGDEMMRFDPDGKVTVRGEIVDSNKNVYEQFREWLTLAKCQRSGVFSPSMEDSP